MTRQTTSKKTPAKPARKAPGRAPATRKLQSLVHAARDTGRAVGRTGARIADPLVQSIQKETPGTLAKMALAALTPRLATYALRFALRNPVMTVAGIILVAAVTNYDSETEATA
jgi:hypothetical protein